MREDEPQMPKWMARIDTITPIATLGLAAVLSGVNPKNLLLIIAGGAAIAQTGISGASRPSPTWSSRWSARSGSALPW